MDILSWTRPFGTSIAGTIIFTNDLPALQPPCMMRIDHAIQGALISHLGRLTEDMLYRTGTSRVLM
jgi:hypothetical protein